MSNRKTNRHPSPNLEQPEIIEELGDGFCKPFYNSRRDSANNTMRGHWGREGKMAENKFESDLTVNIDGFVKSPKTLFGIHHDVVDHLISSIYCSIVFHFGLFTKPSTFNGANIQRGKHSTSETELFKGAPSSSG